MGTRGNYTLMRIRGIPISVDWSWFAVLFLIIWLLSEIYRTMLGASQDSFEPYGLAVISAFLFFGSILLHELGHALVALRNGIGITHITLWMFGGIAGLERDCKRRRPGVPDRRRRAAGHPGDRGRRSGRGRRRRGHLVLGRGPLRRELGRRPLGGGRSPGSPTSTP